MVFHSGWRVANHIHSEHSLPCEGFAQAVRVCPACQRRRPFCHRLGNAHVFVRLCDCNCGDLGIRNYGLQTMPFENRAAKKVKRSAGVASRTAALPLFGRLVRGSKPHQLQLCCQQLRGQRRVHVTDTDIPSPKEDANSVHLFSHLCLAIYLGFGNLRRCGSLWLDGL